MKSLIVAIVSLVSAVYAVAFVVNPLDPRVERESRGALIAYERMSEETLRINYIETAPPAVSCPLISPSGRVYGSALPFCMPEG